MANRNRAVGHKWENQNVKDLAERLGLVPYKVGEESLAEIATCRAFSRARDNQKLDIWLKELNLEIQSKSLATGANYHKLISQMPGEGIRAVLHQKTVKKGTRFYEEGRYAILPYDDFMQLLEWAAPLIKTHCTK